MVDHRAPRGRGSATNPPNRFLPLRVEELPPEPAGQEEDHGVSSETRFFVDASRRVISRNESPDVGFDAGINPYRGCEVGCVYCYARPYHEYLGFSAGLDYETRILVKPEAPARLRRELGAPGWKPRVLALSGATDPYQPAERRLRITRGILEVLAEFRNPVSVITKRELVTRDADLLAELAGHRAAAVTLSITTLDPELQRAMEPRASSPERRLTAIRKLSAAGIPVGVNVAPVIPGLTEHEMPRILERAAEAGASRAGWIPLRLPHAVADLFASWLDRHAPDRKDRVLNRVRELRGGRLNDPRFGHRMRGEGPYADQIAQIFRIWCRRLGLDRGAPTLSTEAFRRPAAGGQLSLL